MARDILSIYAEVITRILSHRKVRNKMGTIIYKPHCARCGATINEEVTYRKLETRITKNFLYSGGFIEIEPNRCENCGEMFGTIEIPIPKESEGEK
jgi:predicted Zn-ribbon and HTH transcriptional regulator